MSAFPQTIVPTTISGCRLWMDAADTSTANITSSSSLVSQITNKANSQIPLIASGAARPTTGSATIGGKNTLTFDGANTYLTANALGAFFSGTDVPMTWFTVFQGTVLGAGNDNYIWCFNNLANASFLVTYGPVPGNFTFQRRDDSGANNKSASYGTYSAIPTTNILTAVVPGSTVTTYNNGTLMANAVDISMTACTYDRFSVGAMERSPVIRFFNGNIGEIIAYNRQLTASEVTTVQRYLGNKWGLPTP